MGALRRDHSSIWMKNISDLVLLAVIAFVFLQKNPTHAKGNMLHIWIWGIFKIRFAMLCFGYGSRWGAEKVGAQPWVGLGQGGAWMVPDMSQHSRAQGNGLQPSSLGVSMFQRWPYTQGSPGETPAQCTSRWDSCTPGSPVRSLSEDNSQTRQKGDKKPELDPWSVPPNKLTGMQDTTGS